MIDYLTDFKAIINQSTENTIVELEKTFKDINVEKNKEFIKTISQYYMVMRIWNTYLKEHLNTKENQKCLDNILLDYCSIVNCVILGDEKLLNFLYRNIIESFLRAISSEFKSKEIDSLFGEIYKDVRMAKKKELLQGYGSRLKQIYSDSCLYVHAAIEKIPENLTNLNQYKINSNELIMKKLIKDFDELNIAMLLILQLRYLNIYKTFRANTQGLIMDILPYCDRINIGEIDRIEITTDKISFE